MSGASYNLDLHEPMQLKYHLSYKTEIDEVEIGILFRENLYLHLED